jgi:ADP-ribosyl-[dinitrogen reductase] hydrolase
MILLKDRILGSLFGLNIGDALGAPFEFKKKGSFEFLGEYSSGGEFNLPKGYWTDDSSLALCIVDSFLDKRKIDYKNHMNLYLKWWRNGFNSSTGVCFDIGNTTKKSLEKFFKEKIIFAGLENDPPTNGAIMRMAPIILYHHKCLNSAIEASVLESKLTHGNPECLEASIILSYVIYMILAGKEKNEIFRFHHLEKKIKTRFKNILSSELLESQREKLNGLGMAYETLVSALYAFLKYDNYLDGLTFVINLGDDTDTVGAVYGQIAGAYYGINGIPSNLILDLYSYKKLEIKYEQFWEIIK